MTDTSTERAEQLAKRLKRDIDWRPGSLCAEAAATLRALAAERDALKAERAAFVRRETADMEHDLREANDKLVDVIAERDALREHIAHIHNRVRHQLVAEIEVAVDTAFRAMSGANVLRKKKP